MNTYTITYYDPLTDEYAIERYITAALRNARKELLSIMGYHILETHNPEPN